MKIPELFRKKKPKPERLYTFPKEEAEVFIFHPATVQSMPDSVRRELEFAYDNELPRDERGTTPEWKEAFIVTGVVTTYIATQKIFDKRFGDIELVRFVDVVSDEIVGRARLQNVVSLPKAEQQPTLEWISTEDALIDEAKKNFQHRGLGERRYALVIAHCEKTYNRPLHSGLLSDESRGLWEKLVAEGRAEEIKPNEEGYSVRYRSIYNI